MATFVTMCKCDECSELYKTLEGAQRCEAKHMHISYDVYLEYKKRCAAVALASSELLRSNNEENRRIYDEACDSLGRYEDDNNIPY